MRQFARFIVLYLILALSAGGAGADPSKGRWWFGGSAGYHTTEGSIEPNAEDDIRPDDYVSREISVEDTISYGLSAGFGMTDRVTLQLDVGYFEGEIGKVDAYLEDLYPHRAGTTFLMLGRQTTESFPAGVLREIPVTLSGVVGFLKDGPFNPYVGAGAGMIFTEIDELGDVETLNERLDLMRIRAVFDENGRELTPGRYNALKGAGNVPLTHPMTVEVDDALGFHLMAGFEFFPGDRISIVADLRYTFMDQEVRIELGGEDEVILEHYSELLFREDGSVKYFRSAPGHPNPHTIPGDPNSPLVGCMANRTGDFDNDGHADDECYNAGLGNPIGSLLIQGGEIDLSGFTAQIGMRFYLP